MIIRKLFRFENAHIVRGCTTQKCSQNIHGHSYEVEILLESNYLDNGQMVYDFGLIKHTMHAIIDAFDHAITLWSEDDIGYRNDIKKHSARWIELPVSPSAEQFSRIFYLIFEKILASTQMTNGEKEVKVYSVIVHETKTGYAQSFYKDAHSELMGSISLEKIIFSSTIKDEWVDKLLWDKILSQQLTPNPSKI
ncbi:MAG TPA: 6-carboxytetrahydropterin synthase [Epsilonproteobacteria bacterium]|nr:6-carboxytetrahydropterin synthase [Campylobacterota bacterium]